MMVFIPVVKGPTECADSSMDDDGIHLNGGWSSIAHPFILLFRVDEF